MQVRSINSVHANKPYHVDLKISNEDLRFKIDTGADETIISLEDYNKENLLGRPALEQLRIVKWKENCLQIQKHISQIQTQEFQQEVFKKYPKLFHGIGNLKEYEYEIKLKENADPVQVSAPRRVPFPLLKEVEKEIKRMEKEGLIEKPTEWCSPMVIASKKNGKVRVCADFTELNAYVKREKFQLPSVDETLSKLQDAKFFSKLGFSSGFWQINLEKNSQKLTTFISPFGRYKYKRILFGMTSAPEVFQKVLYEIQIEE
jgi:predicted aspartyl protease